MPGDSVLVFFIDSVQFRLAKTPAAGYNVNTMGEQGRVFCPVSILDAKDY